MKLTLVGAGPGDPELITLKGVSAIQSADIILYDALANQDLLKYASSETEIVYVGKRYGAHSVSQNEINRIIIHNALAGKHVVRLKGGDPIVFGRGFEEIEYAESFGIETEIVPGISSCISVPTLVGVPVTKRGVSESFWVITGHTKDGNLPKDMYLAAQSSATVIILMGMAKLHSIMEIFSSAGKSQMAVAVIQNGSQQGAQKVLYAEVRTVFDKVKEQGLTNPAVIVIGETVNFAREKVLAYVKREFK